MWSQHYNSYATRAKTRCREGYGPRLFGVGRMSPHLHEDTKLDEGHQVKGNVEYDNSIAMIKVLGLRDLA